MADDEATVYLLLAIAVIAVLGVGLSAASFATQQSMGGMMGLGGNGMMGSGGTTATHPGAFEWAILIVSAAFFVGAVALLIRDRGLKARHEGAPSPAMPAPSPPIPMAAQSVAAAPPAESGAAPAPGTSVPEPTLIKLLDEDERKMYLELRDHGGEMFQRDLVALKVFSKAKVTRVLDKLEAKGLVVREAHGMTNRVRLVQKTGR